MFLFLNRLRGKRPVLVAAALFTTGGAIATLCLGLINWLLGGPFLYILNQINVLSALDDGRFAVERPLIEWVWSAPWLFVPTITFAFSCAYVWLHSKSVA